MQVQCTCLACGKTFTKPPSIAVTTRYCSRICKDKPKPSIGVHFSDDGATAYIPLRSGNGIILAHACIDAADATWVGQWSWHLTSHGYAARQITVGKKRQYSLKLHRALMALTQNDGLDVDHIDRDRLNNRRANLRVIPDGVNSQNIAGTRGVSKYRGVTWHKRTGKWAASVSVNGMKKHLGYFINEGDAAEAALQARKRLMPFSTD